MKLCQTLLPSAFVCALLLLSLGCRPAHAQGPKTFDVTQAPYSADNSGKTDASAAINKAVTDAVNYGNANKVAVTVSLSAGTYSLKSGPIYLYYAQNTLNFTGHSRDDTFLTYGNKSATQNNLVLDIAYNRTGNVIAGNFTEDANDASQFNFTQGTITAFDRAAKTITVKAEAGYPLLNRPDILHYTDVGSNGRRDGQSDPLYTFFDPKRLIWDSDDPNMISITPSPDGATAVVAVDHITPYTYVGEPWVMLGHTGGNATSIQFNNTVTLQNINYYGDLDATDDSAGNYNTGAIKFINYYQGPPPAVSQPGRPTRFLPDRRVTVIEGYQIAVSRHSVTFTGCDLSGGWDDVLDLGGNNCKVVSQSAPNQIVVNGVFNDLKKNDQIELTLASTGAVYATTVIIADPVNHVNPNTNKMDGVLLTLQDNVTIQNPGDPMVDLTAAGPITLQNSAFSSCKGHMFLRSGVGILVDNCLVHDFPDLGLEVVGGAPVYGQGPGDAHNVTIQNSTFKNCQNAAIGILEGNVTTGNNVLVQNNTFFDSASVAHDGATGVAVIVDNINGVVIKNNWFDRNWGANICAEYDKNVSITGNTFNHPNFIRPAADKYTGLPAGGNNFIGPDPGSVVFLSNDDTVTVSGNIVAGAGPYTMFLVKVDTAVTSATGLSNGVLQIDTPWPSLWRHDVKVKGSNG